MRLFSKKISIGLAILIFGITRVSAQDTELPRSRYNISWQISTPLSGMKDWIDNTSLAGMHFEGLGFLDQNIALGGEISYNYFYKKIDQSTWYFDKENYEGAITGTQFRSSLMLPILVKGYYYINSTSIVKPYAGLGAGVAYMRNDMLIGVHTLEEDLWGFSSNAEVGANILPVGGTGRVGFQVAVKYNYANINSAAIKTNNINRLNYNVGITFVL